MIKAVLISPAAGFSLPYLIDIAIPGIPQFQIIPLLLEAELPSLSSAAHDATFAIQVVYGSITKRIPNSATLD